jgi:3'-5' exoribonuclease
MGRDTMQSGPKGPYVADLKSGQQVNSIFLVQAKDERMSKVGKPYLSLVLMDRTGELDAKVWDNVESFRNIFDRDDFIRVRGDVQSFQNRVQLKVDSIQRVDGSGVDPMDFLPASRRDLEEMFAELQGLVAGIRNPHLRALLEAIFADPDIARDFRRAPAAKTIHHNWVGGLIEHVLSLGHLARVAAKHYPGIDEDLLLTGVILHDLGKITELSYARSIAYTTQGQLLGHMQIALRIIGEKLAGLNGFPPKLRDLVEHLVLSHHGALEFGSPKVPVFPEALLLHHLDNLDSKMESMRATLARDAESPSEWTGWNSGLERTVLSTRKYLAGPPAAPAAPPPPAAAPARQGTMFGGALQAALTASPERKKS